MKHIIQFHISKGNKYYVAEGIDLPIVTQGKTLDELAANIQEAVQLQLKVEVDITFQRHIMKVMTNTNKISTKKKSAKQNLSLFSIMIEPLEEGGFLASCPVLQGCRAEGETYVEAIENIQDVIKAHIEAREASGEVVPEVSIPKNTDLRLTLPLPITP